MNKELIDRIIAAHAIDPAGFERELETANTGITHEMLADHRRASQRYFMIDAIEVPVAAEAEQEAA